MHVVKARTEEYFETNGNLQNAYAAPPLLGLARLEPTLSDGKILVVEDDPHLRLALEIRLRAYRYDVYLAASARSAILAAGECLPDLILLDLGLPDEDGYFVIRALQQSVHLAKIPVIVLSGWPRSSHEFLTQIV